MKRLQELYKEVYQCHKNYEDKISNTNLAIAMLTAAHYIEDGHFGDGGTYADPNMNAFWNEMEDKWARFGQCSLDHERIIKALRWGARAFNGTEAWMEAVKILDDIDLELNIERQILNQSFVNDCVKF